jgi:hypothetical protein
MTVNEVLEHAGGGAILMGVLDRSQVIGFRVLNRDGQIVAMFNCAGIELAPPPVSGKDTSNTQLDSAHEGSDMASARLASDTLMPPILSKSISS